LIEQKKEKEIGNLETLRRNNKQEKSRDKPKEGKNNE